LRYICVTIYHGYVMFVVITILGHDLLPGLPTKATRRVPLLEQDYLIIPEYLSSHMIVSGVRIAQSSCFCVALCKSLFVPLFVFFFSFLCLLVLDGFWLPIDALISIVFCYERNIILITIRSFLLLINISVVSTAFYGEKQHACEINNQLFANYFVRVIWMYR